MRDGALNQLNAILAARKADGALKIQTESRMRSAKVVVQRERKLRSLLRKELAFRNAATALQVIAATAHDRRTAPRPQATASAATASAGWCEAARRS